MDNNNKKIEDVFGLYKILEVSPDSTQNQIKKAYRCLALKYHPDKNHDEDAEKKFKSIAAAYNVLSDPEQRNTYNNLKLNPNNEVVLDCPSRDITSDSVFWVGIILGHLISACACWATPFPALLSYFLAPSVISLGISTWDSVNTFEGGGKSKLSNCTDTMKIGVGMFVSPVVPFALTADFTFSLVSTIKNFVDSMEIGKEYSVQSLKMKLEELENDNDWVVVQNGEVGGCKRNEHTMSLALCRSNSGCDEDFIVV